MCLYFDYTVCIVLRLKKNRGKDFSICPRSWVTIHSSRRNLLHGLSLLVTPHLPNNDVVFQFLDKPLLSALTHLHGISQMSAISTALPSVPSQKHSLFTEQQSCELSSAQLRHVLHHSSSVSELMGSLLPCLNWTLATENSRDCRYACVTHFNYS
jgi:hypothetical protein